jgi:hypothetical protein
LWIGISEGEKMKPARRTALQLVTLLVAALIALFAASLSSGQAKKPLTSDDLIKIKKAGFDDQTAINAIAANGVSLDISVQGLTTLKSAGVSDNVINAALSAAALKSPLVPPDKDTAIPDEIGAYVSKNDVLTSLPVELVGFKSSGILGSALTYGIKKGKMKGTVPGANSSARLTAPVTLVLRCADGIAPTEYQLIALESRKEDREFTTGKIGFASVSTGDGEGAIQIKFEKIARNTYRGTIAQIKKGEYGILAPAAGSATKVYTFGVIE